MRIKTLIDTLKTRNPYEIACNMGIRLIYEPLGTIKGYYNSYKGYKFIHVNEDISENEQTFVVAHELGHAIMHSTENTLFLLCNTYINIDKLERKANEFALMLLYPACNAKYILDNYTENELLQMIRKGV